VNRVHVVDTRGWRKRLGQSSTWREIARAAREVRGAGYDIAIDVQGAIKSALMASYSAAPVIWGFAQPRETIARSFYTRVHDARSPHVIDQNLSLARAVIESRGHTMSGRSAASFAFPGDDDAECWAQNELTRLRAERIAIINPGAGWGAKCWPEANYAEVARWLAARSITPLINFGPGEEKLAEAVQQQAPGSHLLKANLPQLIAITRRAALFVGGDTGPLHLASALGVPVVALFGPTDPARNGPYCGRNVVLRSKQSATSYSHVSKADAGLLSITAADALAAAEKLFPPQHAETERAGELGES
jgi:heptosyltransferase-1